MLDSLPNAASELTIAVMPVTNVVGRTMMACLEEVEVVEAAMGAEGKLGFVF